MKDLKYTYKKVIKGKINPDNVERINSYSKKKFIAAHLLNEIYY